jgi:hypothetical protein
MYSCCGFCFWISTRKTFAVKNGFEPLSTSRFEKVQVCFATAINYYCKCKHIAKREAKTKPTMKDTRYKHTKNYAVPHPIGEYEVNQKIILLMQQLGSGRAGATILGGMLSIVPHAFDFQWAKLEEEIGVSQIILGNTILNENIMKEKELSARDNMYRYLFCVSINAGWNNRGSTSFVCQSTQDGTTEVAERHITPILATT